MKNVDAYDISRLMVGALGTLGVLLEVSLKVVPRPARELTVVLQTTAQDAIDQMNRWAGQPLPLSAACYPDDRLYVRLAGTGVAERDNVLVRVDVLTARQFQHQHLVEAGDCLELEAVETFDGRELCCLDPALDHAPFPIDQLQFGKLQQITGMIDTVSGALSGHLVVLAQERW